MKCEPYAQPTPALVMETDMARIEINSWFYAPKHSCRPGRDKRMKFAAFASLAVSFLGLSGCQTIKSQQATDRSYGMAYSLPKAQVLIVAQRKRVTAADVKNTQDSASTANTALQKLQKQLDEAKYNLKNVEKHLAAAKSATNSNNDAISEYNKEAAKYAASITILGTEVTSKKESAEKLTNDAKNKSISVGYFEETVSLTELPVVPDPDRRNRYLANLSHLPTRDDDIELTIKNGLLSSSNVTSADRTADIIVQLAGALSALSVPKPIDPTISKERKIAKRPKPPPPAACDEYQFATIFDPTIKNEVDAINAQLKNQMASGVEGTQVVTIERISPADDEPPKKAIPAKDEQEGSASSSRDLGDSTPPTPSGSADFGDDDDDNGLYYRAPVTVVVATRVDIEQARRCGMKVLPSTQVLKATLPDATMTFRLPATGGAFTTTTADFAFVNGMPTSYKVKKPSELLALASLPIDIAKAMVSVPTELVKLRVDYDNMAASEINAKVEQLKAQLSLLEQQRALEEARKTQP